MKASNVYAGIPAELPDEQIDELLRSGSFRLERIVSRGHATPAGRWYDQPWNEWVMVLRGTAALRIEGQDEQIVLSPGEHVMIPAHVRHRVEWTDPAADTVWLALHYPGGE